MYIPKPTSHYYIAWATDSSTRPRQELINNPITYEIVLMVVLVSLMMLMPLIVDHCLRPCIAPDEHHMEECADDDDGDEQEAVPWNLTLTADGTLLDNETGDRALKYGTSCVNDRHFYNADGIEIPYNECIEAVYDPLD